MAFSLTPFPFLYCHRFNTLDMCVRVTDVYVWLALILWHFLIFLQASHFNPAAETK